MFQTMHYVSMGLSLVHLAFCWQPLSSMGFVVSNIPAELDANSERNATFLLAISHTPIALVEGAFTAFLLPYLRRVRPDMIGLKPRVAVSS